MSNPAPSPGGPGTNNGHGHVWERPDGKQAKCGGAAICMQCAVDHSRWVTTLNKGSKIPGVITKGDLANDPNAKLYQEAPPLVRAAADALVRAIFQHMQAENGPMQHKAALLHHTLMQTQNAVFRASGAMSIDGYTAGLANYIAQALSIGDPEHVQAQWDAFNEQLPEIFAETRGLGWGAGIGNKPKGSA